MRYFVKMVRGSAISKNLLSASVIYKRLRTDDPSPKKARSLVGSSPFPAYFNTIIMLSRESAPR